MIGLILLSLLGIDHPYSVEINKENVFEIISKLNHVIVHFYSDWCPHCAKMAPAWNEISRMYYPVEDVVMAQINCDSCKSLCSAFDGTSTPNIQYFAPKERKPIMYGGEKEVLPMARWIKQQTGKIPFTKPGNLLYNQKEELQERTKNGWVLIVVDNARNQYYNHTNIRNCEEDRDIPIRAFDPSLDPKFTSDLCGTEEHCILLLKDAEKHEYKGEIDTEEILTFIDDVINKKEL